MNPAALTEEGQALRRLLGDAPVVTPDGLAAFGSWLVATLKAHADDSPADPFISKEDEEEQSLFDLGDLFGDVSEDEE